MQLIIKQVVYGFIGGAALGLLGAFAGVSGCSDDNCVPQCVTCNDDNTSEAEKTAYCEGICESDSCAELIACLADNSCDDSADCPGSCD